jgi:hypothetical protein
LSGFGRGPLRKFEIGTPTDNAAATAATVAEASRLARWHADWQNAPIRSLVVTIHKVSQSGHAVYGWVRNMLVGGAALLPHKTGRARAMLAQGGASHWVGQRSGAKRQAVVRSVWLPELA